MKHRTIADCFAQFRREILVPARAGLVQQRETRRAFYAGARALLGMQLHQLSEGQEAEASDLEWMNAIDEELRRFGATIGTAEEGQQ